MALVIRLIIIFFNSVVVGFFPFVLASAIGYLPQTVIFALMGEGMAVEEGARMGLALALFVVSALIGYLLLRRHRAAQVMAQESAPEQPDPFRRR